MKLIDLPMGALNRYNDSAMHLKFTSLLGIRHFRVSTLLVLHLIKPYLSSIFHSRVRALSLCDLTHHVK
jgi:hypothetical protein